jgi:hypothetical protein
MTALFGCCSRAGHGKGAGQSKRQTRAQQKRCKSLSGKGKNGAQSRDRTSDTAIFNRMLYQLSYLGFRLRCQ